MTYDEQLAAARKSALESHAKWAAECEARAEREAAERAAKPRKPERVGKLSRGTKTWREWIERK